MSEQTDAAPEEARAADNFAASKLHEWARTYAAELDLDPDEKIEVAGFHSTHRVAPNGRLVIEIVARFNQMRNTSF